MNLKDFMQKKADEEFSSGLSEGDKEYCKQLETNYVIENVKDKRKLWAFFSCAAAILVAAIIAISIIFAPNKTPLKYLDEKVVSEISTIQKLNDDAKYFTINSLENTMYEVRMNYDSDSNDKLFYRVIISGIVEEASLNYVINPNYEYKFEKPVEQEVKKQLDGYELNYSTGGAGSKDSTRYYAWIQINTETIYIKYTQSFPLGDQAFFDYVQSVIKAK